MKSGIIYKWKCTENGKEYIGQTNQPNKRKKSFLNFNKNYSGNIINRARFKYDNEDKWEYTILEKVICENSNDLKLKLNELEKKYIKEYNTLTPNGYNIADGGSGVVINGEFGYWNGKKRSEETKIKIGLANKGTKHSEQSVADAVSKRDYADIARKNSIAHRGKTRIKIYQYDNSGKLVSEYDSIEEASQKTSISSSGIHYAVYVKYKGRMDYGGFIWSNKKLSVDDILTYNSHYPMINKKSDIFLYDENLNFLEKFKTKVGLSNFLGVSKSLVHYILHNGDISNGIWYKGKFIFDKKIEKTITN